MRTDILIALVLASSAGYAKAPARLFANHALTTPLARAAPSKQWLLWKQSAIGAIYYDAATISQKDGLKTIWWGIELSVARELPSGGPLKSYKEQLAYQCSPLQKEVLEKTGYDGAFWSGKTVLDQRPVAILAKTERSAEYGRFGTDLCSGKLK